MKTNFFSSLSKKKSFAIAEGIGAGLLLSFVFFVVVTPLRAEWVEPGCNPNLDGPDCAGSAPINVSNADQTKLGGLTISPAGTLTARGTLTAEGDVNFPNNAISGTEIADETVTGTDIQNGTIGQEDLNFPIPGADSTFDTLTVTNAFNVVNGPTTLQGGGLTVNSGGLEVKNGAVNLPSSTIKGQLTVNGVSTYKAYLGTESYAGSFTGPIYTDSSAQVKGNLTVNANTTVDGTLTVNTNATVAATLTTNNLTATGTVNLSDNAIQTNEISDDAVTLAKTNFVTYSDTWDPPSIRSGEISTREFTVPESSGTINVGDPVILATDKDMRDFVASAEVLADNKVRVTIWLKLTALNGDLGSTRFNLIIFKFQ